MWVQYLGGKERQAALGGDYGMMETWTITFGLERRDRIEMCFGSRANGTYW